MLDLMPTSLQQRLLLFILLPVALVLTVVGTGGFIYARNQLLDQWGEATALKLQRSAHQVDMGLSRPKAVMMMFQHLNSPRELHHARTVLIRELMSIKGVRRVNFDLKAPGPHAMGVDRQQRPSARPNRMQMPWWQVIQVTSPAYDEKTDAQTITLLTEFTNPQGQKVGRLEVIMAFDALVGAIESTEGWQDHRAYLIDDTGNVLTQPGDGGRGQIIEHPPALDENLLTTIRSTAQGAVIGEALPPPVVTGFYRLQEAPWTLVIQAPGQVVLAPIVRFRLLYFALGAGVIFAVLFLIRSVTAGTMDAIQQVSRASTSISRGNYEITLPPAGKDEVGELIQSFTTMVTQLKERSRMKDSLDLAMEVQRQLLPQRAFCLDDLCIAGVCDYCDETGGDYYDVLDPELMGDGRVGIAVGDVSGHGVAAALLMTTARALVRAKVVQSGNLAEVTTAVNKLLIRDTAASGNFVTLFLAAFDRSNGTIEWVRAGHDPALLYNPVSDRFSKLGGKGIALGVDDDVAYERYSYHNWQPGQIVLIATDGVWETENLKGERFGKTRLKDTLRHLGADATAETVITTIMSELKAFRGGNNPSDDATVVAIRWRPAPQVEEV